MLFYFHYFVLALVLINSANLADSLPETTGMIVLLVASLAMLNGLYVGLVVSGPLSERSEEE